MQPKITPEYLASQGLSPTFPERFWNKVQKTDGCWIWTAAATIAGYGLIGRGKAGSGNILAHVASWILNFGPVPNGYFVCHNCPGGDIVNCVNPSHLWLGTPKDNSQDMCKKGHSARGERSGSHKLTEAQVIEIKRLYALGGISHSQLAARYGVCRATITLILIGKNWSHIKTPVGQRTDRQGQLSFSQPSTEFQPTDTLDS